MARTSSKIEKTYCEILKFKEMKNSIKTQEELNNQVEEVKVNVMDLNELKKKMAKARKDLTSLENKNMNPAVIEAQKKIVEELEVEVANHPEMKASEIKVKPDFITFEVVDGDTRKQR